MQARVRVVIHLDPATRLSASPLSGILIDLESTMFESELRSAKAVVERILDGVWSLSGRNDFT